MSFPHHLNELHLEVQHQCGFSRMKYKDFRLDSNKQPLAIELFKETADFKAGHGEVVRSCVYAQLSICFILGASDCAKLFDILGNIHFLAET